MSFPTLHTPSPFIHSKSTHLYFQKSKYPPRASKKKEYAQREVEQNGHFLDREVTKSLDGTKPSHRQRFARRGKAGLQVKTAVGEAKVNQRSRKLEGGPPMDARGARSQNPGMKLLSGQVREWSKKARGKWLI
ncbi:hypothetical protein CEXT_27541 [Caerostris extrusa]|uniref:Uncharacterized protein n=1 Tax=Caerostris extrusa TaxID=172846 RepID=A0AAV4T015_CAEEX|nr:hypothetical protein CEXT_27541 [Caerostris extrusa]